jgi:hypothetical protein
MTSEEFMERYSAKLVRAQAFLAARGIRDPKPVAEGPALNFQTVEARVLAWREEALASASKAG